MLPVRVASVGANLAGIGEQLAVLSQAMQGPSPRIAELLRAAQQASAPWRTELGRFGKAMQQFVEEQRRLDERTDEFVARHGWPVPTSLLQTTYRRIVSMAGASKREVTALMVEGFRPGTRTYYSMREVLDESPHFASRRPLLRQVYAAQRRRQWYLVINALLPLVEGVLIDAMFPRATRPKSIKPGVEELKKEQVRAGDGAIRAIETMIVGAGTGSALFDSYEPLPGVEPRTLNRHAVLHGSARRYGTEQNATKLFLLLVVLAESIELYAQVRRHRSKRTS